MTINMFSIGRILIGIYFLLPGIAKVFLFSANLEVVIAKEVPFPIFSLSIVAMAQIIYGSYIIFGKHLRISSIALAITTLLINFYIHDFWNLTGDPSQAHETQNFVKNIGILAGLLILSKEK
ncbi:MAG: DoxX family protein [Gammaproteobacteria bacterium]|jgi:putative oxidoreductase